jgi:hypothetical protein
MLLIPIQNNTSVTNMPQIIGSWPIRRLCLEEIWLIFEIEENTVLNVNSFSADIYQCTDIILVKSMKENYTNVKIHYINRKVETNIRS